MTLTKERPSVGYKGTTIKEGQTVVLLESYQNGVIEANPLSRGKIVGCQNQVEADIWLRSLGVYHKDPINRALDINNPIGGKKGFRGVVVNLPKKSFAMVFNYDEHNDITVKEENASTIPFFHELLEKKIPSRMYINGTPQSYYLLRDIREEVEDKFIQWVQQFETRELTDEEIEDGCYAEGVTQAFADVDMEKILTKKEEVELQFAKVTGVYVEFYGGLIWE